MPESSTHRDLVNRLVREVSSAMGGGTVVCRVDGVHSLGIAPPVLYGHRPDVFAFDLHTRVIGEAKPPSDLESERSRRQLHAFISYVAENPSHHLVLAVHWETSVTAKGILRRLATQSPDLGTRLHVSDGVCPLSPLRFTGRYVDNA